MWPALTLLFVLVTVCGGLLLAAQETAPFEARLLVCASGVTAAFCLRQALRRKPPGVSFGSAAFASHEELSDLLLRPDEEAAPGSVFLGLVGEKRLYLPPHRARQHGVIVGGSGTGKSFGFFLPNAAMIHQTSAVFSDPKSELFRYTSGFHSSLRFAPCEPDASECFNWVPLCREVRIAEITARALIEAGNTRHTEQVWLDVESAFLAALFSHASVLPVPTPLTAYHLFTRQEPKVLLDQMSQSPSPVAREQSIIFRQTSERMRGSIVPAVAARLQFLRDPDIARFTSASLTPPEFAMLRRNPTAVYWCLPEKDAPRLRPLTSLFFTLLLEQLSGEEREDGGVPVLLLLDEFGAIGAIPEFATTIALARGRGLGLWLGVQSLSQLEHLYGHSAAKIILTNCAAKIALSGLDVDTAEYFSRTAGQGTIQEWRRSFQARLFSPLPSSVNDALREHGRALLTADELRRLPEEEMFAILGNRKPVILGKYRYEGKPKAALTGSLGPAQTMPFASGEGLPQSKKTVRPYKPPPLFPEDL